MGFAETGIENTPGRTVVIPSIFDKKARPVEDPASRIVGPLKAVQMEYHEYWKAGDGFGLIVSPPGDEDWHGLIYPHIVRMPMIPGQGVAAIRDREGKWVKNDMSGKQSWLQGSGDFPVHFLIGHSKDNWHGERPLCRDMVMWARQLLRPANILALEEHYKGWGLRVHEDRWNPDMIAGIRGILQRATKHQGRNQFAMGELLTTHYRKVVEDLKQLRAAITAARQAPPMSASKPEPQPESTDKRPPGRPRKNATSPQDIADVPADEAR